MTNLTKITVTVFSCFLGIFCVDYHALEDHVEIPGPFELISIPNCDDSVPKCIKHLQEHAHSCEELWKRASGAKYDECMNMDAMKTCYNDWKTASITWYSAFKTCLTGGSPPPEAANVAAATKTMRFKRDHHEHHHKSNESSESSEEDLHTNHSMHYRDHVECLKALKNHKTKCAKKYTQCEKYNQCSGHGTEPTDETAKIWFRYASKLRKTSVKKAQIHFKHLSLCLVGAATGGEHHHHHEGHHEHHDHHHRRI